jgi:hypothetical protein
MVTGSDGILRYERVATQQSGPRGLMMVNRPPFVFSPHRGYA